MKRPLRRSKSSTNRLLDRQTLTTLKSSRLRTWASNLTVSQPSRRKYTKKRRSHCKKNSWRLIRANKRLTALNEFWKNAITKSYI